MSKLYRPANGTEGMIFESRFCDLCVRDIDQDCDIHNRALLHDDDEPEYPREWTYDSMGYPTCTAFATEIQPPTRAELEGAGQHILPLTTDAAA